MSMIYQILFLVVLIILSGIFSGSETAFTSVPPSKVQELYSKRKAGARTLKKLKENPHRLLITILIGNNVVNIGASAYAAVLLTEAFGSTGLGIATGAMTFLILVFGEITPKSYAHSHAAGLSLLLAKPFLILEYILWPLIIFFELIIKGVNLLLGKKSDQIVTEDELVAMVKLGADEGAINKEERELIENVLEFNDISVSEVMVPRTDVQALSEDLTLADASEMVEDFGHSRIPVYRGDLDHIVGILNIKDLFRYIQKYKKNKKLKTLEYGTLIKVPFSKKINVLFHEFQKRHIHMAVVIDEYGGTSGIVAMEDILEEIVGEIADEFDEEEKAIDVIDNDTLVACGDITVKEVSDALGIKVAKKKSDSLNALILREIGRFPNEGETITLSKINVKILEVKDNVIERVRVKKRRTRAKKR
jgi:putative hemolysin